MDETQPNKKEIQGSLSVVSVVSELIGLSSPLRMCHSPVEQKWNSTSAITEQRGAKEVFELERRKKSQTWVES